ncbi:P-loop containing nucleoside triphosphate hydrolase protein [Phanerochaete sordida]|uniref:DNA 3'-5' helicase n=1 Tax=Phanerochaete sordida TaxID=48140 RepID=A0A9P3LMV6_9APHY|nr:P-loop containing nucleoside triphosphate hydrolase protein [Phanerochaete sordida]
MTDNIITLDFLDKFLSKKFSVAKLRDFQLKHSYDICLGKDVFLVVAAGGGKTYVMASGPLVAQHLGQSAIGFIVAPTKILTEQHAKVLTSIGLRTLAINEDSLRLARDEGRDLWQELLSGDDVRLAVVTPWMMDAKRVDKLLKNQDVAELIRWMLLDEVHLFNESDKSVWREPYRALKELRARMPSSTAWGAFTGTASVSEAQTVASGLGFRPGYYVDARYSLDRPNLKYITRFMAHSVSGWEFWDLAWVIPFGLNTAGDIPTTLIFCDTIDRSYRIMTFLDRLIPETIPGRLEKIKLCNSLFPQSYRERFKNDMESGKLRVGVCTETCTYGVDIRNVRRVIVFGEVESYSRMKQELCRAGRDGQPAVAYAYAPLWVKDVPPEQIKGKKAKDEAARREKLPRVLRDFYNAGGPGATRARCPRCVDLEFNSESIVLPAEACCSHCHPSPELEADMNATTKHQEAFEADTSSKEPLPRSDGTYDPLESHHKASIIRMLSDWRHREWNKIRSGDDDNPPCVFFPTHILERLAQKVHVCTSFENFCQFLADWDYLGDHGKTLFAFVTKILKEFEAIIHARQWEKSEASPTAEEVAASAAQAPPDTHASGSSSTGPEPTPESTPSIVLKLPPVAKRAPSSPAAATSNSKRQRKANAKGKGKGNDHA